MDACEFNGVKTEDNAAIPKLRSFKCIAKVFRFVEFCFVFLLLLWIFTSLPFAVRISGEYFRQIVEVILSPVFIFIICNFIVLTLLFNSGHRLSGDDSSTFSNDSFLENAEFSTDFIAQKVDREINIVYEDKQMIFQEVTNNALMKPKLVPRRIQSEKMNKESIEEISVKIRRSETEKCRKVTNSGDILPETEKCRKVTNSGNIFPETEKYWKVANSGDILTETEEYRKVTNFETEKCRKFTNSVDISSETEKCRKFINSVDISPEAEKCRKFTNSGDILPETEKCRKVTNSGDIEKCRREVTNSGELSPETVDKVDELSNDEFKKAIENFIAKQIKFHQQEKLAIVLHSKA